VSAAEDQADVDRVLGGDPSGFEGLVRRWQRPLVNLAFRQSFLSTQNGNAAYLTFICFYVACVAVTWAVYRRRNAPLAGV